MRGACAHTKGHFVRPVKATGFDRISFLIGAIPNKFCLLLVPFFLVADAWGKLQGTKLGQGQSDGNIMCCPIEDYLRSARLYYSCIIKGSKAPCIGI
jgi:hypothetical protein